MTSFLSVFSVLSCSKISNNQIQYAKVNFEPFLKTARPALSKMATFTSSLLAADLANHELDPFAVFALHR
jgi:hypothetical protein